ncbi:hypothetical protein, partial [Acinetobacter baumannii]
MKSTELPSAEEPPAGEFGREGASPFDTVRAIFWLAVLIVAALLLLPVQMVAHALKLPARHTVPM